jgi:hypothetical protein
MMWTIIISGVKKSTHNNNNISKINDPFVAEVMVDDLWAIHFIIHCYFRLCLRAWRWNDEGCERKKEVAIKKIRLLK